MTRFTSIYYTPTISGSSGVAAGQVLSATEAIGSAEGGELDSVQFYNLADITRGVTMYLFGANTSVGAESAAFAMSDTGVIHLLARIQFNSGSYLDFTNNLFQVKVQGDTGANGLGQWMQANVPSTDASLYAALAVNSTGTKFTTGSLAFRFNFKH